MALPLAAAAQQVGTNAPVAHTTLGDFRGAWIDGLAAFHGVPYAAPPVGNLRFAPAAPVLPWEGQRDVTRHGPVAPQLPPRLNAALGRSSASPQGEDCLTLTILTPAPDAKARPVIVWLHGGAFLSGAGSLDQTNGSHLARDGDLVFVGVNYRLGALGWLHLPGIVDAEAGMSDMIAALSWVKNNIASFGGDPSCVTVMGQSAGANAIARMLMTPEACTLFQRAILQSPSLGRGFLTSAMAAGPGEQFLRLLDVDPGAGNALACLRAVEVPRLLRAQGDLMRTTARFGRTAPPFMPLVPTAMTQAKVLAAIADGAGSGRKDILIGVTADEGHAFFAADPMMEDPPLGAVVERFGSEAMLAGYRHRRPGATMVDLLADLQTDETFTLPAMRLADAIAARGGSAHAYLFDWAPPASRFKSCHCIELPFVFGTLDAWQEAPMLTGGDAVQMADLSAAMRRAWIAFVRTGTPEHEGLPPWPRYEAGRQPVMRFGARIGVANDPTGLRPQH